MYAFIMVMFLIAVHSTVIPLLLYRTVRNLRVSNFKPNVFGAWSSGLGKENDAYSTISQRSIKQARCSVVQL